MDKIFLLIVQNRTVMHSERSYDARRVSERGCWPKNDRWRARSTHKIDSWTNYLIALYYHMENSILAGEDSDRRSVQGDTLVKQFYEIFPRRRIPNTVYFLNHAFILYTTHSYCSCVHRWLFLVFLCWKVSTSGMAEAGGDGGWAWAYAPQILVE